MRRMIVAFELNVSGEVGLMKTKLKSGRHWLMTASLLATGTLFGCDDTSDVIIVDGSVNPAVDGAATGTGGVKADGSVGGAAGGVLDGSVADGGIAIRPPGPCQGYPLPADQHFVADGLCVGQLATEQGELRQLTFAPNGDLFGVLVTGQIRRYRDINKNGVFDSGTSEILDWADTGGFNGHNVHIDAVGGFIYAGTAMGVKRWPYTVASNSGGVGEDVMDGQPSSGTHKFHPVHVYNGMMYVSSGSENNIVNPVDPVANAVGDYDTVRAVIKRFDLSKFTPGTKMKWSMGEVFSRGLRNVVGFTQDASGRLYGVVNGIDGLRYKGEDVSKDNPGETLVLLEQGKGYGYPYCFTANLIPTAAGFVTPGTQLRSEGVNIAEPMQPFVNPAARDGAWCAVNSTLPLTTFQAHTAPLDIVISDTTSVGLPLTMQRGAFVSLHGSWNRTVSVGHTIVFVPFDATGRPALPTANAAGVTFPYQVIFGGGKQGQFKDGLWSWSDGVRGETRVRVVGVAISPVDGALYVSSDNGRIVGMPSTNVPNGAIYRISKRL